MKTALLTLLIVLLLPVAVYSQTMACAANHNAPPTGAYIWPSDSEVKVYFYRNMFTPAQKETLLEAMKLWTQAAKQAAAGVSFTYGGEIEGLIDCRSCLTVTRQEIFKNDHKHYAFFHPLQRRSDGLLISAWIDFDFATVNAEALQGFMTHELGHGMGLGDCTSCKKKQTIMNGFPGINRDNGLIEPSACDLEVVRQVYQLQRQVARNSNEAGRD